MISDDDYYLECLKYFDHPSYEFKNAFLELDSYRDSSALYRLVIAQHLEIKKLKEQLENIDDRFDDLWREL